MANRHRGEISAEMDGRRYTMCLTLGALAELESAFGDEDMLSLATRFESGRLSARDAVRVLGAGLRGAGNSVSDADVAAMKCDGGAAGFVGIVARLLEATFGAGEGDAGSGSQAGIHSDDLKPAEVRDRVPFPGSG